MGLFSKLFSNSKEIVPSIDFSKYSQIKTLSISESNYYSQIRYVINNSLNEYADFYRESSGDYVNSYKNIPKGEVSRERLLEMTSFTWTIIQQVFKSKRLPQKVGFALYYSVREAFMSLDKELNDAGHKDFDDFFQGRDGFYVDRMNELFRKDYNTMYTYKLLQNILMLNPLKLILDNDPSNIQTQLGDPVLLMRFSEFIKGSLIKSNKAVNSILQ